MRAFGGPHRNVLVSLIIFSKGCVTLPADARRSPRPGQLPPCVSPPYPTDRFGSLFHVFGTELVIQVYLRTFRSAPGFFSVLCVSRVLDHGTNWRIWEVWNKGLGTGKPWREACVKSQGLAGWEEWGSSPHSSSLPMMFSLVLRSDTERNRSGLKM